MSDILDTEPTKAEVLALLKAAEMELREAIKRLSNLRLSVQIEPSAKHVCDSETWEEFKRTERRPGHCVCCDRKLRGQRRLLCGAVECRRLMEAIYKRGYRAQKRAEMFGGAT